MAIILVDARHYGHALRTMRKTLHMKQTHAARLLGIDVRDFAAYERGRQYMPDNILDKIMLHAFVVLETRYALTHPKRLTTSH